MPIRILDSGAWRAPVADGKIKLKWGGSTWQSPGFCKIKVGSTVGVDTPPYGGAWADAGYRAYPNPPGTPYVYSWNYTNVQAAWSYAAAGGSPIAHYEVQLLYPDGSLWAAENSTDNLSPNWGPGQDTRSQIRVRSVGTNGLVSAWSPLLKIGLGHPSTPNYGWVQRTRSWYSQINGNWIKDKYSGGEGGTVVYVPNTVYIQYYHHDLHSYNNLMGILSPYGNRTISYMQAGADAGAVQSWGNPYQAVTGPYWSNGANSYWGPICRGTGWTVSEGGNARMVGVFGVEGTEYYNNWEIVSYNPEQANYYW